MSGHDFRRRADPPCGDCDHEGYCTMNCGPASPPNLSNFAWAVLGQLARGSVWDGALVAKRGRDELVSVGLARRVRRNKRGLAINELTDAGRALAARLLTEEGQA